eukprot:snap_masked-scaffold_37-processed-gene-1.29-mRNA-1 protein AED:1.00 eAED:1.00 QI:0/-1/0/0/-1/1/1/0/140
MTLALTRTLPDQLQYNMEGNLHYKKRNAELISADYKPYSEWTKADRRAYHARALRKHRKKKKMHKEQEEKRSMDLQTQVCGLYLEVARLQDLFERCSKQQATYLVDGNGLFQLSESVRLSKELLEMREKTGTLKKILREI